MVVLYKCHLKLNFMLQTNSGKPVYKNGHQFPSAIKQEINNAELVSLLTSSFQLNGSVSLT